MMAQHSLAQIGLQLLTEGTAARTALVQIQDELKAHGLPAQIRIKKIQEYYPVEQKVLDRATIKATTVRRGDTLEVEWSFNRLGEITGFGWRVVK